MWRGYSLTWYHADAEDCFQILFLRAKSIGRKACSSVKKKDEEGDTKRARVRFLASSQDYPGLTLPGVLYFRS